MPRRQFSSGSAAKASRPFLTGANAYPVSIRYADAYRRDPDALALLLVSDPTGQRQVAFKGGRGGIRTASGPSMLRDENGLLTAYVSIDLSRRDLERSLPRPIVLFKVRSSSRLNTRSHGRDSMKR